MILGKPATVKLLGTLAEVGARGATREELLFKSAIAKSSFYRSLKALAELGLIGEEGDRYRLLLDHPYGFQLKRLHDLSQLYELPSRIRDKILSLVEHARVRLGENLLALWLVGSAAHQTMEEGSDLDFLAVVREPAGYLPEPDYPVHFIVYDAGEFRELFGARESFVLSALEHGLLLEDRGFAQAFYAESIPVKLSPREVHQEESEFEKDREQFLFYLRQKARPEALAELSHFGISAARRMLRLYGVLPAGKPDLFRACSMLFGDSFAQLVEKTVTAAARLPEDGRWISEALELRHRLQEYSNAFSYNIARFRELAELVTGSATTEHLASRLLGTLFPRYEVLLEPSDRGLDLVLRPERARTRLILVLVKALRGPITAAPVQQLLRARERFLEEGGDVEPVLLLIANPYREFPLLERPEPFPSEVRQQASEHRVVLRTALELVATLNRLAFEEAGAAELGREFLGRAARK